jgi:hypothetical protein
MVFALVYVPGLNGSFGMAPVGVAWMLLLPLGAGLFVALDVVRRTMSAALPARQDASHAYTMI